MTKSASFLGRLDLGSLTEMYNQSVKKCVVRMYENPEPFIEFERLPSGRFITLKYRTDLGKICFRPVARVGTSRQNSGLDGYWVRKLNSGPGPEQVITTRNIIVSSFFHTEKSHYL